MSTRLLVLAVDAASPILIEQWVAEGKLPAIRRLIDRGLSGSVQGIKGFFVGSTWPSFYTGLNPAAHGFYRIKQLKSGTYEFFRPLESLAGIDGTPFWRLVSDAGRRVVVFDVPLSRLDPELNGIETVEWGGHDSVFGFQASPNIVREIMANVGAYPLPPSCDGDRQTAADYEQFVRSLEQAVRKKLELTLHFLGREDWDLFVQVFTEAHCVGHQCWHIHDRTHPAHDPTLLTAVGDPLERVYQAIDRAVGTIVERVGGAHVLLVSPHGMSHYRGAKFLLPEILFRLGAVARPSVPAGPRGLMLAAGRAAWRSLPERTKRSLRPLRSKLKHHSTSGRPASLIPADVARSKCFPIENGSPVGGIRLNLVGREPQGVLHPGREADEFCGALAADLCSIVDHRTGRPLISEVHLTRDLYGGARRDALPDLLVEWDGSIATGTLAHAGGLGATVTATSSKIGTVEGKNSHGRTGEHVPTGMFIFVGSRVSAAEQPLLVSVMDFHPTICRLLGLPDPGVDGVVIDELIGLR